MKGLWNPNDDMSRIFDIVEDGAIFDVAPTLQWIDIHEIWVIQSLRSLSVCVICVCATSYVFALCLIF